MWDYAGPGHPALGRAAGAPLHSLGSPWKPRAACPCSQAPQIPEIRLLLFGDQGWLLWEAGKTERGSGDTGRGEESISTNCAAEAVGQAPPLVTAHA